MFVLQLMSGSLLLHLVMNSGFGHSLWGLATYISGPTQFPEFSMVLMLDDIQVGYYDSETNKVMKVGAGGERGEELDLGQLALDMLLKSMMEMRRRLDIVRKQLNLTSPGVYVQQRMFVFEVQEDGQPDFIMVRNVANGHDADSIHCNMTHFLYGGGDGWDFRLDTMRQLYEQMVFSNIYLPFCVQTLQRLLESNKHLVMRRVRPRLRLLSQPGGGGAQITCLATDFYPRHINLTLLRDGEPVDEEEMTVGSVLPNGNGLYQLRKTLMVDEEELQRKHKYTCAASHLSLDNRLDVSWRAESFRLFRVHVISAPVVLLVVVILLLVLMMKMRKRKRSGSEGISMETQESPGASTDERSEPGVEDQEVTAPPKQISSK
ncbi:major histocompatibility complex class I-related gene protein-like [Cololabis saira]|uniref:major histocompatibility complex class I-related gene protein-like n=1 Tax=Cololabis saira TaxID=129043 RepID=UPI002AD37FDD|nr:major histocompatibility complex class I-related gene protein-like [Cololabis saira]